MVINKIVSSYKYLGLTHMTKLSYNTALEEILVRMKGIKVVEIMKTMQTMKIRLKGVYLWIIRFV